MKKKTEIVLRSNNCISNDPCILCGGRCDPTGLDYMLEGTYALVCDTCANKHAPDLVSALNMALSLSYARGADPAGDQTF